MLPEGWDRTTVGDVCDVLTGGTPKRSVADYWNGDIPWMSSGEINQGVVRSVAEFITPLGMANSNARLLPPGTVMMALNGQGKTRGKVAILEIETTCNQSLAGMVADGKRLLPTYLFYSLDAQYQAIRNITGDDARNGLNLGILRGLSIDLPPLDEQRRIAEVLRSVDEALDRARQVADQCEQVLQLELDSIVAKLLADGVAQVKLGEVANVKGGKRLPKGSAYSDEQTDNPYIRVTDWRDYEIRTNDIRFISDDIAQSIWRYTISKSDLFISIAGSVGLVAAVPTELDGAYLTENAAKICIHDPKTLNATFLLAVLRSSALAEQISKHKGVGGGVPKLALFRIEDLDIPLPDLSVQAEIARSYQSVRASIEAARTAVGQLELTKKNVMSDLLSGRVRVPT